MNASMKDAPFHQGELRAQQLAGGGPPGFAIRGTMPEQHRSFFSILRYLLLATTDNEGWPRATIVTGPQDFVRSAYPGQLTIGTEAMWLDGIQPLLHPGKAVGMLGIDLRTRRRNRVNGVIGRIDHAGVHLDVEQSFGNCPKYIQVRDVQEIDGAPSHSEKTLMFDALDDKARAMIENADTFFVATSSGPNAMHEGGVDISHKGGRPGFIRIDGNTLTIPDFAGNRYFNTFGNMLVEPRAAILIVDFATGDVLHLQGTSEILWRPEHEPQLAGAQRLWRFHVKHGWHAEHAVALRWTLQEFAQTTQETGIWAEARVRSAN